MRENPKTSVTDVLKRIGEMWRDLDEDAGDKEQYVQLAAEDKVRYKNEVSKHIIAHIKRKYILKLHIYI